MRLACDQNALSMPLDLSSTRLSGSHWGSGGDFWSRRGHQTLFIILSSFVRTVYYWKCKRVNATSFIKQNFIHNRVQRLVSDRSLVGRAATLMISKHWNTPVGWHRKIDRTRIRENHVFSFNGDFHLTATYIDHNMVTTTR